MLRIENAGGGAFVLKFNIGDNQKESSTDISRNRIPLTAAYKTLLLIIISPIVGPSTCRLKNTGDYKSTLLFCSKCILGLQPRDKAAMLDDSTKRILISTAIACFGAPFLFRLEAPGIEAPLKAQGS